MRLLRFLLIVGILIGIGWLFAAPVLTRVGGFLIDTAPPRKADAAVVLATGVDYYPRLMEAADLYRQGLVHTVVIDGNRKSAALRSLEARGYEPPCHWAAESIRILELLGVPENRILAVSAEDAYDTISEAMYVGARLQATPLEHLIITTSKFHTRRAAYIWRRMYPGRFVIQSAAAAEDPFRADGWWREGRQIRQLLAEYGAWAYYFWKITDGVKD